MPHLGRGLGDDPEAAAVRVRGRVDIDAFALALAGNQVVAAHRDSEDLLVALSAEGAGYATLVGRNEAATQAAIVNVPNARGLPLSLSATKTAASPSFIELLLGFRARQLIKRAIGPAYGTLRRINDKRPGGSLRGRRHELLEKRMMRPLARV
jgi:hypothetical protein